MSDTPHQLSGFAGELRSLVPSGNLDRDQLMFRAGQASMPRPSRLWLVCTGILTLTSLVLIAVVALRPEPAAVERVAYVQVPALAPAVVAAQADRPVFEQPTAARFADGASEQSQYLRFRDQVIRWGPDALPRGPADASASRPGDLHDQLGMPPGALQRGTLIGGPAF